jgi:hypothetical protein
MNADQPIEPRARPNETQAPVVRFPLPTSQRPAAEKAHPRLGDLLPRRWRRRVVIQGQRFWIPG